MFSASLLSLSEHETVADNGNDMEWGKGGETGGGTRNKKKRKKKLNRPRTRKQKKEKKNGYKMF